MNPPGLVGAYLHALIDTRTGQVVQVLCLSDERATTVSPELVWALLLERHAPSFAEARSAVLEAVRHQPYWQWALPWMPEGGRVRRDAPLPVDPASPPSAVRKGARTPRQPNVHTVRPVDAASLRRAERPGGQTAIPFSLRNLHRQIERYDFRLDGSLDERND